LDLKLKVARAQLGSALELFLRNKDPFSVHALACGGGELMEGLAKQNEIETFSTHILKTFPELKSGVVQRLRNKNWNAIKHYYSSDHKTPRDDKEILESFQDQNNDAVLFVGWYDYMSYENRMPLEAQVFQTWWYALNESKLHPNEDVSRFRTMFPDIMLVERREQKRRLKRAVEKYSRSKALLLDPKTELGPLMITC
jgi:hypothetical protein